MANSPFHQSTSGAQSPVVNTDGNVEIKYDLSEEKFAAMLQQQQKDILQGLRETVGSEQDRTLLEQKLQAVQEKLTNLQKSYEEELQRRKAADEALGELKGQLPDEQIKQAKASLEQGNTKAAEDAFDAVVDREGERVALAAFQSGQLAAGRLDYAKAMRQYKKAVVLKGDNV
ncbi:hypothetical protein VU04_03310, partial [Desulfobulbus sp. TB]|nr:hypothetical protein [Desulfobulbus sp. TB]